MVIMTQGGRETGGHQRGGGRGGDELRRGLEPPKLEDTSISSSSSGYRVLFPRRFPWRPGLRKLQSSSSRMTNERRSGRQMPLGYAVPGQDSSVSLAPLSR